MINNNDDSNYLSIKKEVVEVFRHQNPQGYFHLLYLITDFNAS